MCRAFHDRYGLSYVGLRYMNVYGPHQLYRTAASIPVLFPIMLNKIDADQPPVVNGDSSQAYDFIDVVDVARCNVLALQADVADEFYNVGAGGRPASGSCVIGTSRTQAIRAQGRIPPLFRGRRPGAWCRTASVPRKKPNVIWALPINTVS